ncbi:YeeE/YedE family integral membrane protein-like protein [Cucurbitaria berberidis CBS 394.84]|uniref:YeeE/YedE family integral membrane protein-like protein n=1 Tax=Cucurbitaria berberidis CBS 394.84 TaxID=1168544 RepID=A0A9P4LDN6_9PLEO|nr:YeeE/YedE family integral membrane protein-like protein [Cucurbitaria berberidis CBS 394.84]KAF1852111.1 YeeE/YedE family integral membrane protein-like protein [Cucurbitaria berberidis CBS 394.84]
MFTPVETSIGALLLHQATSSLLYQNGNILGASGSLRQLFSAPTRETMGFFAGMAASYFPLKALAPQLITSYPSVPITLQVALFTVGVGLLVGWGTKTSNGCTSGHMLCGLSRLSGRSAIAVATFFPVALITHHLVHPTLYTEACPGDLPCYKPIYPSTTTTASLILLAAMSVLAARTVPKLIASITTPQASDKKLPHDTRSIARSATQFFSGLLFALGLHISQMSHPAKVASFFSFPSLQHWDPSLALVILLGVLPNLIEIQRKGFKTPPSFADKFSLPTKTLKDVDVKFVAGAAAFGVGWGLTGTCPGPAVLRAFAQPVWGSLWMTGFWVGGRLGDL